MQDKNFSPRMSPADAVFPPSLVLHKPMVFKEDSLLHAYLVRNSPSVFSMEKTAVTLSEIMIELDKIISTSQLYDWNNPVMIFLDPPLEYVLGVRVLHYYQVKWRAYKHLFSPDPPSPPSSPPLSRVSLVHRRTVWPFWSSQAALAVMSEDHLDRAPLNGREDVYTVHLPLLGLLRTIPDFDRNSSQFPLRVIFDAFSKYLVRHKETFIDQRMVPIAIVENTPLGSVLGVRAFARSQVHVVLRPHLSGPVTAPLDPLFTLYMCMALDGEPDQPAGE